MHMHGSQIWVTVLESHSIQTPICDVSDLQGLLLPRIEPAQHDAPSTDDIQVLAIQRAADMRH